MNIAFVSTHLPSTYLGGAEILTEIVTNELAKQGHRITIYTSGSNYRIFKSRGVTIKTLPELKPKPLRTLLSPIISYRLRKRLQSDSFFISADIVHAVDADTLTLLLYWSGITNKLVATIQDYAMISPVEDIKYNPYSQKYVSNYIKFIPYIRKYIRYKILSRLKYAISVSKYIHEKLICAAPHVHSEIIGNALTSDWFKKSNTQRDIDLLYVGRLQWHKGLDILLQALPHIHSKKRLYIYIIGGGNYKYYAQKIMQLQLQHQIKLVNEIPYNKIKHYYNRTKILVVPSIWPEPCGRTIIEGMACGCAVIATQTGGTPESFRHKQHGLLVPPANQESLQQAIQFFLDNPASAKTMGNSARHYAKKTYTLSPVIKKYMHFYGLIKSSH